MRKIYQLLIPVLILYSSFSNANLQSHDELKDRIAYYLNSQLAETQVGEVHVNVGHIDPRLQIQNCPEENLEINNPYGGDLFRASTVEAKCTGPVSWKIYVPVNISIQRKIVAAKHPIPRGTRISKDDLFLSEQNIQRLRQGYFTDINEVSGKISKHNIPSGKALSPYNLSLPKLVKRGEEVMIIAGNSNFKVSMKGIAMESGILGETVRVKNLSSQRTIDATVSAQKEVKVQV